MKSADDDLTLVVKNLRARLRAWNAPFCPDRDARIAPASFERLRHQRPELSDQEILKKIIEAGLDRLRLTNPDLADLLCGRYWEGLSVREMLMSERPEPQSERRFFQQQKLAIEKLARMLNSLDRDASQAAERERTLSRLPLPTYNRLFGVERTVQDVCAKLTDSAGHPILVLKGVGGIGKTAIADAVVRRLAADGNPYRELIWISAKQEYLTPSGIVGSRSQIRLDDLFNELVRRFGIDETAPRTTDQKVERLAVHLRRQPYLLVIDNLETVDDLRLLMPYLRRLAGVSRFLLTSRTVVPALANLTTVEIGELDRGAAAALTSHLIETKGLSALDSRPLFSITGGNPLAIILLVSLSGRLAPDQLLDGARSGALSDLYTFIYRKTWSMLSEGHKELLLTIHRCGDSVDSRFLALIYQDRQQELLGGLGVLLDLSLVTIVESDGGDCGYAIHRLTSIFLRTEMLQKDEPEWGKRLQKGYLHDSLTLAKIVDEGAYEPFMFEDLVGLIRTYCELPEQVDRDVRVDSSMVDLVRSSAGYFHHGAGWRQMLELWPIMLRRAAELGDSYAELELGMERAVVLDRIGESRKAQELFGRLMNTPAFDGSPTALMTETLLHLGTSHLWRGNHPAATEYLNRALNLLCQETPADEEPVRKDRRGIRMGGRPAPLWEIKAYVLNQLGNLAMFRNRDQEAERFFQASHDLFVAEDGTENLLCVAYQSLGRFRLYRKRYDEAVGFLERGIAIRRWRGDMEGLAASSIYLAGSLLGLGRIEQAEASLEEALSICRQLGHERDEALCHLYLGQVSNLRGMTSQAIAHWTILLERAERIYFHSMELQLLEEALVAGGLPEDFSLRARSVLGGSRGGRGEG